VLDFAIGHLNLAGAAQAVTTGVRQINAGAQRGVQDGLAVLDLDRLTDGFNGELVAHGVLVKYKINSLQRLVWVDFNMKNIKNLTVTSAESYGIYFFQQKREE
jgi:hypothetical protein